MIRPGTRQHVAQLIAAHLARPVSTPAPMASPCEPGFMARRQAS